MEVKKNQMISSFEVSNNISVNSRLNSGSLLEPSTNTIASDYVIKHWKTLVFWARKFGASWDRAEDLVQDMMLNLLISEREGNGFDSSKGKRYDNIEVENMIFGRLKLYAKDKKYHKHTMSTGENNKYVEIPSCSDFNGEDSDGLNGAQYAYATAGNEDECLDDVVASVSIRQDIENIVYGPVILRNFLKNIGYFVNNLDNIDLKGIFSGFKLKDSEYADSLRNIIGLYSIKPDYVDSIIMDVMIAGEFM